MENNKQEIINDVLQPSSPWSSSLSCSEILQKIKEMKKELNRKQRKLEKVKHAARVKAHVRQKMKEYNDREEDHITILPPTVISNSDSHSSSQSVVSGFTTGIIRKVGPKEIELQPTSRDDITMIMTSPENHDCVDSGNTERSYLLSDMKHEAGTDVSNLKLMCSENCNNQKEKNVKYREVCQEANLLDKQMELPEMRSEEESKSQSDVTQDYNENKMWCSKTDGHVHGKNCDQINNRDQKQKISLKCVSFKSDDSNCNVGSSRWLPEGCRKDHRGSFVNYIKDNNICTFANSESNFGTGSIEHETSDLRKNMPCLTKDKLEFFTSKISNNKSVLPSLDNVEKLSQDVTFLTAASGCKRLLECVKNDANNDLFIIHKSGSSIETECIIKHNSSAHSEGFELKIPQNQSSSIRVSLCPSYVKVLTDDAFMTHESSGDSQDVAEKSLISRYYEEKGTRVNEIVTEVHGEHCDNNQLLVEICASKSTESGHEKYQTNVLISQTEQTVTHVDNVSGVCSNSDPDKKSFSYRVDCLCMEQTHRCRVDMGEDKCRVSQKEIKMHSEGDEDFIKESQGSTVFLRPCLEMKSKLLVLDPLQNTVPPTPSFGSLSSPPINKSLHVIKSNSEEFLNSQESVTDSEFFNILGVTQTQGEMMSQTEIKEVNVSVNKLQNLNLPEASSLSNWSEKSISGRNAAVSEYSYTILSATNADYMTSATSVSNITELDGCCKKNSSIESVKSSTNEVIYKDPDNDTFNSEDTFPEYTELDAIPYSQFELSEDFLSETQENINIRRHITKNAGPLVMRRSSRISSFSFTHSYSQSLSSAFSSSKSSSGLKNDSDAVFKIKSRQGSLTQQKKTAAILSVFQFLIDEARKVSSPIEFELPRLFHVSQSREIEVDSKTVNSMESEVCMPNENIEPEEECLRDKTNISYCSSFLFETDIDKKLSKKQNDKARDFTVVKESSNFMKKDVKESENNRISGGDVKQGLIDDFPVKKQQISAGVQEINSVILERDKMAQGEMVAENSEDNNSDITCRTCLGNVKRDEQSVIKSRRCTSSLSRKMKHIHKQHDKFSHSLGRTVPKKQLFASNSGSISSDCDNFCDNFPESKETIKLEDCSVAYRDLSVGSTSGHFITSSSCMSQKNIAGENFLAKIALHQDKSPNLEGPIPTCQIPSVPKASSFYSFSTNSQIITSVHPIQLDRDSKSLLTIVTNLSNMDSAHTPTTRDQLESPEINLTYLQSPVTPDFGNLNHVDLTQTARGISLTSTPKVAACRTSCAISEPNFNSHFDDSKSSKFDGSYIEKLVDQNEQNFPCYNQQHSPSTSRNCMVASFDFSSSPATLLHPDEGCFSPAEIPIDARCLHLLKDTAAVGEFASESSHVSTEYSVAQCEVSAHTPLSSSLIVPWKKLPKTSLTPVLVFEKCDLNSHFGTPVFSPGRKRLRSKSSSSSSTGETVQNNLKFGGCFQCCTQDAVVSLLCGVIVTKENVVKHYIVSVQATSLTLWTEDVSCGWTAELDWRLDPEIHIMKACIIPRTDGVVAVVASGWDKRDLFVTLFVYDWNTQDTARFNIPVIEQQNNLKSPTQIDMCPFSASELHISVTSDTHHTLGSVIFSDCLRVVQSLSMFGVHRGKLVSLVLIEDQISASISLTSDQELSLWNMKLGVVLKKLKLQPTLPCLTEILAASSNKGLLFLDTVWRADDGYCGGVIILNPLTGEAKQTVRFSVPNNSWKSVESAKQEGSLVIAVSDHGSLGVWNRKNGILLGYTKSKITTCAAMMMMRSAAYLIVGEIHGCVHIYSTLD